MNTANEQAREVYRARFNGLVLGLLIGAAAMCAVYLATIKGQTEFWVKDSLQTGLEKFTAQTGEQLDRIEAEIKFPRVEK